MKAAYVALVMLGTLPGLGLAQESVSYTAGQAAAGQVALGASNGLELPDPAPQKKGPTLMGGALCLRSSAGVTCLGVGLPATLHRRYRRQCPCPCT